MWITFRPLDEQSESPDRRLFVERCCAVLTDRYDSTALTAPPPDDPFPDVHLDVSLYTDRRVRPPTVLPPLSAVPATVAAPIRVQYLPQVIGDHRALEQLTIGAALVGVGSLLRRNPALSAAARRPLEAMGSVDVDGHEPPGE